MNASDADRSIAVIGCGAVVEEFYAPALQDLERQGWRLYFVDASAGRARDFAARFCAAQELSSVEAVCSRVGHAIVATPPASHFFLCSQLLAAGVDVLCEKPLVLDVSEARELIRIAAQVNRKLHVNQTRRWFPASVAAKRLVAEGAIGETTSISFRSGTRFSWPSKTAFHSAPGLDRNGILSDQGSHVFDVIGWILGCELDPVDVQHDGYAGSEATVRVQFSSGVARGEAVMTWLLTYPSRLEFAGTKGKLILDDDCNRVLLHSDAGVREVAESYRYTAYSSIASDLLTSFVSVDHPRAAPARTVLPSIAFLDRAYRIAKAALPHATELLSQP